MDSNTIRIGLMLIILVWSVISAITYMMRRSDNKGALRQLKQNGQPLRRLSAEEQALLQPFLVQPAKPTQSVALVSDGVFPLRGAFVRHGLESSHGGTTMHNTLGDVDVVLPYDALDYLREDNQAEVVVTEKFAIVVGLNGEFDLAGGREREARRQQQNQQWNSGKLGDMPNVVDAGEAVDTDRGAPAGQAEREFEQAMRVEILSQRDETPAEIAARRSVGIAFWPAMLWLAAFGCLGVAAAGGGWPWLAGAAPWALLALWLTWRRRPLGAPQKVNRARGELNAIVLTNPANAQAVSTQLFLGDKIPVSLPDHWRQGLELPEDRRVDVDLRVEDYAVLRLGQRYSVDEEQRRFPQVFWGRHVTLALAGLIAGAALGLGSGDQLPGDLALTTAWARGAPLRTYESAAALAQDPPAPGDMIALKGAGRCQFQPDADRPGEVHIDCARVRWQGDALAASDLGLAPAVLQLYSGGFLKTRPNPMMDLLVRTQVYRGAAANPLAGYNARNISALTVSRVTDLVLTTELACDAATGEAIAECDRLKSGLVDKLLLARDEPVNWLELLRLAQAGAFKQKDNSDDAVIISRNADEVRNQARASMALVVRHAVARASQDLAERQRGGVVLNVAPGPYAELPQLPQPRHNRAGDFDPLQAWNQRAAMMAADGALPFQVAGFVTAVGKEASGATVVDIDAQRALGDPWPSLARVLWLALAALLLLVHLPLALLRLRAASARKRALAEYAKRPAPARAAFF